MMRAAKHLNYWLPCVTHNRRVKVAWDDFFRTGMIAFALRRFVTMLMAWAEDRATRGRDPSADPGAKTEEAVMIPKGRTASFLVCSPHFGISTKR